MHEDDIFEIDRNDWWSCYDLKNRIKRLPDADYVAMLNYIMREYGYEGDYIKPNTPETINQLGTPYEVLQFVKHADTYDETHEYIMLLNGRVRTLPKHFGYTCGVGLQTMAEYILEHDEESLESLHGWKRLQKINC